MDLFSKKEGYEVKISLVATGTMPLLERLAHAIDPEYPEEGVDLTLLGKEELLGRTGWESITQWSGNEEELEIEVIMERTPTEWLEDFTERFPEGLDIAYAWRKLPNGESGGWKRIGGEYLSLSA